MNIEAVYAAWEASSPRLLLTLAHFLWQGLALAAAAWLAMRLLRRAPASTRYGVLTATLAFMVICPVGTYLVLGHPGEQSSALSAAVPSDIAEPAKLRPMESQGSGESTPSRFPDSNQAAPVAAPTGGVTGDPPATPAGAEIWWRPLAPAATAVYTAGVVLLLARLLFGLRGGRKLRTNSEAVTEQGLLAALGNRTTALRLRAVPALALCRHVTVPTVVGVLKPTILLPFAVVAELTLGQIEAILAHELAHVRRHDLLVNLLQRLVEAFLFFHPAVWWLSRQIRIEREHCCDDLAVSAGAKPLDYAASLLRVAQLSHSVQPRTAVAAVTAVTGPSSLRRRIARLLGAEHEPPVRLVRAWPLAAVLVLLVVSFLSASVSLTIRRNSEAATDNEGAMSQRVNLVAAPLRDDSWGEASGGLQARIVAVTADTDEQKPDLATAKAMRKLTRPEDLTLLVELKNVSGKPLALQGTRYGDTVAQPWPGKSVSDTFAPHLFRCEFFDKDGKRIECATRQMLATDGMLSLSSSVAETLTPGKSLTMLIRPLHWDSSMAWNLFAGDFSVRVEYRGPSGAALKEMKRVWPKKPVAEVWTGAVASKPAAFRVEPVEAKRPALVWGETVKGLRAAVELRNAAPTPQARRDTATATFPLGSRLSVFLHVENVGTLPITFWSETWRQEDTVTLVDETGNEKPLGRPWYSGWARMDHWTLKPGQSALLPCINVGIAAKQGARFDDPIGSVIVAKPGKTYRLRYEVHFDRIQRQDKDGNVIVPGPDDWKGALLTGASSLTVRERRPEDEPPTFTAVLQFESVDGKAIQRGDATVRVQSGGRPLLEGKIKAGALEVPRCPFEALSVQVRAPGFEESLFYDVVAKLDQPARVTLKPADPVRFRLVTRDGKPVAGAKVRFFNRSKGKASGGPYPVHGITGPVWATSNAAGEVALDMLQKSDPLDNRLGNNVYWFYIEPADLAPSYLGPIQAGENLGDIKISPLLEARGTVRGTKAELAAFAAEWDQPEPMKNGSGKADWQYGVSKRLETKRNGDKLTFKLPGLRPGKLRIISRFQQGGKPISHTYGLRQPNEDDVVFEIELTESRSNLIVANRKRQ
jgi:beta-lactamase regulating signal transducer with metallopeptidase domain